MRAQKCHSSSKSDMVKYCRSHHMICFGIYEYYEYLICCECSLGSLYRRDEAQLTVAFLIVKSRRCSCDAGHDERLQSAPGSRL